MFRTLSLSLPPEAVTELDERGKRKNVTAARVAAEIVLADLGIAATARRLPSLTDDGRAELRALEFLAGVTT